jgi:solute:Na+ symporter, SSS family
VFGAGALGLFALPYTILVYPLVYLILPKLWEVGRARGYVTASDFVRDRFDSRPLALMVAITGIVATMPYIALQMYGMQVVIGQMGVPTEGALIAAFTILALFTFVSGLRAPALISIVKDVLIWITVLAAVIWIPVKLGGFGHIFAKVPASLSNLPPSAYAAYTSLALGSAMALFLYPHAITGVFSARSRVAVERNTALLPAYTFMLGLIALLGYMAISAGIKPTATYGPNSAVPQLLATNFPGWFAGFAFAAIAIGALVPASVMSIAAANLFSRNVWKDFIRKNASPREETTVSKWVSLVVKVGALVFVLAAPTTYVINFQLAGGTWILQTLPAVFLALFVRWMNRWAVLAGWAAGIAFGTYLLVQEGFESSTHVFSWLPTLASPLYIALMAVVLNVVVAFAGTALLRLVGSRPQPGLLEGTEEPTLRATA